MQEIKVHMEPLECQGSQEHQEMQVHQVHQDHLDHREYLDLKDQLVIRDQTDQLDLLDLQALQVMSGKLEMKDLLGQLEITEFQEKQDQLVLQAPQDHLVTSAICYLVISGTLLMETRESLYTEASEQLMIIQMKTWINSLQGVTNCSRTLLISGKLSLTNTSSTRDWEPRKCPLDHAKTCSNLNQLYHQATTGLILTVEPPKTLCLYTATLPTTRPVSGLRCLPLSQ